MDGLKINDHEKYLAGVLWQCKNQSFEILTQIKPEFIQNTNFKMVVMAFLSLEKANYQINQSSLESTLKSFGGEKVFLDVLMFCGDQYGAEAWKFHLDEWKEKVSTYQIKQKMTSLLSRDLSSSELIEELDKLKDFSFVNNSEFRDLQEIAENILNPEETHKIKTGLKSFDDIGGLRLGEMLVLAGKTIMGKSAFMTSLLASAWENHQVRSCIFSFEMDGESVVKRMISHLTQVPYYKIDNHSKQNLNDKEQIQNGLNTIMESGIKIYDKGVANLSKIRLLVKKVIESEKIKNGYPPQVFVFDFMQLISGSGNNENERVSDISRSLKMIAQEFHVSVIALSQLNRKTDDNEDSVPELSNLRGSGSIEQDANRIVFVHRPLYYKSQAEKVEYWQENNGIEEAMFFFKKNRNDPTDAGMVHFHTRTMTFKDV